jgi:hypothetical protein
MPMCIVGGGLTTITKVLGNREIRGYKFGPAVSCPILAGSILTFHAQTGPTQYKWQLFRDTQVCSTLPGVEVEPPACSFETSGVRYLLK